MTDIEIANSVKCSDITSIASKLNIDSNDIELYGNNKAKINPKLGNKHGKLILVTAINPTPFGEGKTTVSIGLGDALNKLNKSVALALREPSMGPVFGMKGGATGGGYSQVIPMEDINLNFTGDIHAITSANNLLSAAIDNHIFRGNELRIKKVLFKRCLDVNDRNLRDSFDITAASEVMAILTLSNDIEDLERRLGNIIIGINEDDKFVYAKELNIVSALTVILKDAIKPNLVQTLEHTPVFIHGGPFANIAHGCSSIIATKLALSLSDYVITEAGFGADLGAEKFFDIKCRNANIKPDCIILVATIKALKHNGNGNLEDGLSNLKAHINNLKKSNTNIIVCLNKYTDDLDEEIEIVRNCCLENSVDMEISSAYIDGGEGAINLANLVLNKLNNENDFKYLYDINLSIKEKIETLATNIYNATGVNYTDEANKEIDKLEQNNLFNLPICVAKTQYSLSDDKNKLGYPSNYSVTVKNVRLYNGAGFITVYLGDILTMPGLPEHPNYEDIKLINGKIIGLS